jgi:hypothetical protein
MKVTQATTKIKETRRTYLMRVYFWIIVLTLIAVLLCSFYLIPYYSNPFWKGILVNSSYSLYSSSNVTQIIIFIIYCVVIGLITTIGSLIISYKNNIEYQEEYLKIIYNELSLNSIFLSSRRVVDESPEMEFIYKSLELKNVERDHLYTFNSLFDMNFYQLFSKLHRRKDYSLLISSNIQKGIDGYVQIRFNTKYTCENYEDSEIFQYNFSDTRKYSYDIFVNSSKGKATYQIIDNNVLNTMIQLKKFTNVNIVVTITDKLFYVWIPGWELKLTDSLFKKLSYDRMDKKVEIFTELIDEIVDLYIYLVNKEDIWEKKW